MASKKKTHFVGIDVGAKSLHLAFHDKKLVHEFENTAEGHKTLVRFIRKRGPARVVVEVTGVYGLDLAIALDAARGIELFYINPLIAKGFAQARLGRGKSDRIDARMLAELARCFTDNRTVWQPPAQHAMELRAMSRRIHALKVNRTRELNRRKAQSATTTSLQVICNDIDALADHLKGRIKALRAAALEHIQQDCELQEALEIITSTRGIGEDSAIEILGELCCMPTDLTTKQLVAQAGLDPRPNQSGMLDGPRKISKCGNKYLRAAMHMPAVNATHHNEKVKGYYRLLVDERKKPPVLAYTAIARRLLVSIHVMLKNKTPFDPDRFYTGATPPPPNLALATLSPPHLT